MGRYLLVLMRASLLAALLLTITAARAADTKLVVADALTFDLGPIGSKDDPLSFLVWSSDASIDELLVVVEEVKGPDGKVLGGDRIKTSNERRNASPGGVSYAVTLTPNGPGLSETGDFKVTLRIVGVYKPIAKAPDPDPAKKGAQAAPAQTPKPATEAILRVITIRRPAIDIEPMTPLVVRLYRGCPWAAASGDVTETVRLKSAPGIAPPALTARAEPVYKTPGDKPERDAAPGTVTVTSATVDGKTGQITLKMTGFEAVGELVSAILVEAPALGREPKRIPLKIIVTDGPLVPFLAIFTGVAAAVALTHLVRRWRPSKELRLRLLLCRAQIEEQRRLSSDAMTKGKLDRMAGDLRNVEVFGAADAAASEARLKAVEDDLKALIAEHKAKLKKLEDAARAVREKIRALPPPGADAALLHAVEEATKLLGQGLADDAERHVREAEAKLKASEAPVVIKGVKDDDLDAEGAYAPPPEPRLELQVIDPARARVVRTKLSFVLAPKDVAKELGDAFEWTFDDGSPPITTNEPSVQHEYSVAGDYYVTVSVQKGGREEQKIGADIVVMSSRHEAPAKRVTYELVVAEILVSVVAALIATLTAFVALYNGKVFGTYADYIGAILWGFGVEKAVRGFSGTLSTLQGASGGTSK